MEKKITERQMFLDISNVLAELAPIEDVEEYNRIFGTDFVIADVEWQDRTVNDDNLTIVVVDKD